MSGAHTEGWTHADALWLYTELLPNLPGEVGATPDQAVALYRSIAAQFPLSQFPSTVTSRILATAPIGVRYAVLGHLRPRASSSAPSPRIV